MEANIARRIFLWTMIGILAIGPFAMRAFRHRPLNMQLGENSELFQFRKKYKKALDFPRKYMPVINKQLALQPPDVIAKVIAIHKRRWQNFARIDEAEFDYSSHAFNRDGSKQTGNFFMDAHVRFKYGYGLEVRGKDVKEKPIHWVFNMDGNATLPAAQEMNLSSMMLSFFRAYLALPENAAFSGIHAENVELPNNPYVTGNGKYDVLEGYRDPGRTPRVNAALSSRSYWSRNTGMPELRIATSIPDSYSQRYIDDSIPLPPLVTYIACYRYTKIDGIYLPTEITSYYPEPNGGKCLSESYSNIIIKQV